MSNYKSLGVLARDVSCRALENAELRVSMFPYPENNSIDTWRLSVIARNDVTQRRKERREETLVVTNYYKRIPNDT